MYSTLAQRCLQGTISNLKLVHVLDPRAAPVCNRLRESGVRRNIGILTVIIPFPRMSKEHSQHTTLLRFIKWLEGVALFCCHASSQSQFGKNNFRPGKVAGQWSLVKFFQ